MIKSLKDKVFSILSIQSAIGIFLLCYKKFNGVAYLQCHICGLVRPYKLSQWCDKLAQGGQNFIILRPIAARGAFRTCHQHACWPNRPSILNSLSCGEWGYPKRFVVATGSTHTTPSYHALNFTWDRENTALVLPSNHKSMAFCVQCGSNYAHPLLYRFRLLTWGLVKMRNDFSLNSRVAIALNFVVFFF